MNGTIFVCASSRNTSATAASTHALRPRRQRANRSRSQRKLPSAKKCIAKPAASVTRHDRHEVRVVELERRELAQDRERVVERARAEEDPREADVRGTRGTTRPRGASRATSRSSERSRRRARRRRPRAPSAQVTRDQRDPRPRSARTASAARNAERPRTHIASAPAPRRADDARRAERAARTAAAASAARGGGARAPSHAVSTAHSGVRYEPREHEVEPRRRRRRERERLRRRRRAAASSAQPRRAATPRARRASPRRARWKKRVTARPKPCSAPHTMNVQLAPCHSPPSSIVSDQVDVGAPRAAAVAAERDVEVVAQPRRQADVPAPPELLEVRAAIRRAEVLGQREAEHLRRADRDVGVRREVEVDLERVARRRRRAPRRARTARAPRRRDRRSTSASVSASAIFLNSPTTMRNSPRVASRARAPAARRAAAGDPARARSGRRPAAGRTSRTSRTARPSASRAAACDRRRSCTTATGTCGTRCRPAGSGAAAGRARCEHVLREEVGVLEEHEDAEVRAQADDQRAPCAAPDRRCRSIQSAR